MTLFEPQPVQPPVNPAPPDGASRVRMVVAYEGTNFHGFAPQHNQRTVAAVLSTAIERFVGHTVELRVRDAKGKERKVQLALEPKPSPEKLQADVVLDKPAPDFQPLVQAGPSLGKISSCGRR